MNVRYLCRKSPQLIQVNPFYNLQSYSFNIHFKIIFPSTPNFSNGTFSFRLPYQYFLSNSLCSHACHMHRQFILLNLIVLIIYGKHYSSSFRFLQLLSLPLRSTYSPRQAFLYYPRSTYVHSLTQKTKFHTHKKQKKYIMVLRLLVFKYQKGRQEILNSVVENIPPSYSFITFLKCNIITAVSKYMEVTNSLNSLLFLQTTKKRNRVCTDRHYIYCYNNVQHGQ